MSENIIIGPHLLGRVYVPSKRDWNVCQLNRLLESKALLDAGGSMNDVRKAVGEQSETWWEILWKLIKSIFWPKPPAPPGPPQPPEPVSSIVWQNTEPRLNQANTPHCVGFSWSQWSNTLPVNGRYKNEDGHKIYYECKIIDGQPGMENGSQMRSGAHAMKKRGRLLAYATAQNLEEVIDWLPKGSVPVGTNWHEGMFNPDANGFVRPTGRVVGGHAYLLHGHHKSENVYEFQNSWGSAWGKNGCFKMHAADFAKLLANQGDAICAIETE